MSIKKKISIISLIGFICCSQHLISQERKMDRAMVFTKSGYGFSGYLSEILIGIEDDTLVLFSLKQTEKIPIGDLSKIIVLPRNQNGDYFLAGALVGTYAATLFFGQSDQQPTAFLTEDFSKGVAVMLTTALGVGVGGGIGGLFSDGSNNELILDFNRIESEKRAARAKLYELLSGESKFRKIHFSVQGGHVFAHVSEEFKKITGHDNSYGFVGRGSEFNMLRKMQLTYSVEPDVEIGVAIQWSSEPNVSEYSFTSNFTYDSINNQYNYSSTSTTYEQLFHVTGYYGIGKYKPFYSTLPRLMDIAIGGGIGIVNIEYKRGVNTYQNYYYQQSGQFQNVVNENAFSVAVFGEFNVYLKEYLTLGITADYAYFSPIKIPSDPLSKLPEQTLLGNACIGFVLGIHL